MAKKNSLPLIYLIGMIVAAVGCFLPVITINLGILGKINWTIIDAFRALDNVDSWFGLLTFVGAVLGIVFCFVGGKNADLLKIVALAVSVVFGLLFFYRGGFFEHWFKITGVGFYVIIAGWIASVVGIVLKK